MAKLIKNVFINYDRMEAAERNDPQWGANCVGYHRAEELLAMACEDITPDGTFSDFECVVWEMFQMVLQYEGLLK